MHRDEVTLGSVTNQRRGDQLPGIGMITIGEVGQAGEPDYGNLGRWGAPRRDFLACGHREQSCKFGFSR
jgi:hypothetical protein